MPIFPTRIWWQTILLWGVAMLVLTILQNRHFTLDHLGKDVMIWAAAGLGFGLLLTALVSLLPRKKLFCSGFPEIGGVR